MATLLLAVLCSSIRVDAQENKFKYLTIDGNRVTTENTVKFVIRIDPKFNFLGELDHQPLYGEKKFNVSFAAFSRGQGLAMIHAEMHTDGSGGLDYSDLKPAKLNGLKFNTRDQCATAEDDEELASNPEIKLVRDAGFELSTPFFIRQFFATSLDGKSELVISYGRRVADCSAISKGFKNQIDQEIKRTISVKMKD